MYTERFEMENYFEVNLYFEEGGPATCIYREVDGVVEIDRQSEYKALKDKIFKLQLKRNVIKGKIIMIKRKILMHSQKHIKQTNKVNETIEMLLHSKQMQLEKLAEVDIQLEYYNNMKDL